MSENGQTLQEWRAITRSEPTEHTLPEQTEKAVYLLCRDILFARDMALQLQCFGYKISIADELGQLMAMISKRIPACVIIDSPDSGFALTPIDTLCVRAGGSHDIPILLLAPRSNFEARLEAVRAGVDGYFGKPLDIALLAERIDALTMYKGFHPNRVLIVCSHIDRSAYYEGICTVAGMEVMRLQRPVDILRMLDQFRPDAVLVDVDTPGCTAAELTALVRQDPVFTDVPLILLSDDGDASVRHAAIKSGADDFILKPIPPDELIFSLSSKIERYRALRGLIMHDRLTSLYNHAAFKEQLIREMTRARREKKPLALAMLDLDFFKKINDSHGHPVGDHVIRSVSRLLRQRLRHSDVVGRYGGEEFGVILPGTSAAAAVDVLNGIREEFQKIRHKAKETEFRASFSAGIAELGNGMDLLDAMSFIHIADTALYHAKRSGRNRVELVEH